jgi:rhodanese-related sulfurtransferase
MDLRRTVLQALILIVLSSAIAIVANGFASRTRRLMLPGFYPNALKVPPKQPEAPAVPPAPVTTATVAPVTETIVTETVARIEPAATTTTPGAVTPVAPQQTPKPAPAPQVDPLARFQPHPDKAAVEISGEDAALLHSRGVLFLDARRTAAFEESHIAGARPFSVWEADIDDKVSALFDERSDPAQQNQPIVIYCTGGACEDSHMLAQKLWGIQFNNVYVYKDGFPDWQKRGGAVRSGPKP